MADEPLSENAPSSEPQSPPRPRRGRRGGRGRRGRARRRDDQPAPQPSGEPPPDTAETDAPAAEIEPRAVVTRESQEPRADRRHASPEAVQNAIEHVNRIIETLRESLDEMEEVLETLEFAERQKNADEAELDSLRRSLTRLQKPR